MVCRYFLSNILVDESPLATVANYVDWENGIWRVVVNASEPLASVSIVDRKGSALEPVYNPGTSARFARLVHRTGKFSFKAANLS